MINNHFPCESNDALKMKNELLQEFKQFADLLPSNVLDKLLNDLGGPDKVAELTGRKRRWVKNRNGQLESQSRAEPNITLDSVNIREKDRFMYGNKNVAIISDAASTGISLQNDKNINVNRRRVHITLELPWSADRAVQQFGRTHRSNQFNAPMYVPMTNLFYIHGNT